ncbi:MAG: hypothetical protein HYU29_04490 [Chloroflexi bacterium]|nr:hypothetical protein [Chloroflexota bacterium]
MYGTIFRMKVKPGQEAKVAELFNAWTKERGPKVKGSVAGYVLKPDKRPGELIGMAVFKDKATYKANAADPAQDKWFRQVRALLQADPEWEDGEYLAGGAAS